MKIRRTHVILTIIFLIIISGVSFRIYSLNKDVAKEYFKEEYKIGDEIQLDNLRIKISSVKKDTPKLNKEYKQNEIRLSVDFDIKVTSKTESDFDDLCTFTSILKGASPDEYKYSKDIKLLKVGDSVRLNLVWVNYESFYKGKDYIDIYIDKQLYKKEITEKYKEGFMYAKYIRIPVK